MLHQPILDLDYCRRRLRYLNYRAKQFLAALVWRTLARLRHAFPRHRSTWARLYVPGVEAAVAARTISEPQGRRRGAFDGLDRVSPRPARDDSGKALRAPQDDSGGPP